MIQLKKDFTPTQYERVCNIVITGKYARVQAFMEHMLEFYDVNTLDDLYTVCDGLENVTRLINLIDLRLSLGL